MDDAAVDEIADRAAITVAVRQWAVELVDKAYGPAESAEEIGIFLKVAARYAAFALRGELGDPPGSGVGLADVLRGRGLHGNVAPSESGGLPVDDQEDLAQQAEGVGTVGVVDRPTLGLADAAEQTVGELCLRLRLIGQGGSSIGGVAAPMVAEGGAPDNGASPEGLAIRDRLRATKEAKLAAFFERRDELYAATAAERAACAAALAAWILSDAVDSPPSWLSAAVSGSASSGVAQQGDGVDTVGAAP